MKRETALSLKIGSVVHCHATDSQGFLNRKPYVNVENDVVLPCISVEAVYKDYPALRYLRSDSIEWEKIDLEGTPISFWTFHHASTAVYHKETHAFLDFTFDMELNEFTEKAYKVYEKMGWEMSVDRGLGMHIPHRTEIHDIAYGLAEECLKGDRTKVYQHARIHVLLSNNQFVFLLNP